MATLYDEDVPDDEKVMDATNFTNILETTLSNDGTDAHDHDHVNVNDITPIKQQGHNIHDDSMAYTPETKSTAATASPSTMDSPYSDDDDDNGYDASSSVDDDHDDHDSHSYSHIHSSSSSHQDQDLGHDQNTHTVSFQSVQSTLLARFHVAPSLIVEEEMAAEYQTQSDELYNSSGDPILDNHVTELLSTAIVDSLLPADQDYLGNVYEASLAQDYLGNSSNNNNNNNNEEHNPTTSQEEEETAQPPLTAESSSTSTDTNTANNSSTNEETLQPLATAFDARQSHVQAQEMLRQKLSRLRSVLPTSLPKPNEEQEEPTPTPVEEVSLSTNQSEKETPAAAAAAPTPPPVTTVSSYTHALVPWASSESDKARTAVRRAEKDLRQVFAMLGFPGRSTVEEESSNSDQLNTSTSSNDPLNTSTLTGASSCPSDEKRGRVRHQPPPPSLLDLPSSSNNNNNNNGMDEISEDGLLFDDLAVVVDDKRPATPTLFAATCLSAWSCNPTIARVSANIGRAPTRDADSHDVLFGEEQQVHYPSASVPTMVRVHPRSSRTRIGADPVSGEMMANLGLPSSSSSSVPNQSSHLGGSGYSYSSETEIYRDHPEYEVSGESNKNNEAAVEGRPILMPALSECGAIVLVEKYDEIEAQTSPWSMDHPKGDPKMTTDKKTWNKKSATSWIIANKTLLILIMLVTSAVIVAATLGVVVTTSVREKSKSDSEDSNSLTETNPDDFDFNGVTPDTATPSPTAASSVQATMDPGPGSDCVNQISPDDVCYQEGANVFVLFDNCDPLEDDWIGIYSVLTDPQELNDPLSWLWTCGDQECRGERTDGVVYFDEPLAPGTYRVYLFRRNPGRPYSPTATSNNFEVAQSRDLC